MAANIIVHQQVYTGCFRCCYEFWCCPCFACSTTGDLSVQVAVHHKYGIRGSLFEDILVSCFCACCSWCQMAREITKQPPTMTNSNVTYTTNQQSYIMTGLQSPNQQSYVIISSVGPMIECSLAQGCEGERKGTGATNRPCCLCLAGSHLSTGILCL
uniref:Uncharacterized protein n=1 Tax=Oncorhynchus mykiss TaxID=8022 RepID=A0A8L0DV67_ONCMY